MVFGNYCKWVAEIYFLLISFIFVVELIKNLILFVNKKKG